MRMRDRWKEDAKGQAFYSLNKKVQSVMIGGAIGDALDVPYECKKRDMFIATDVACKL